MPMVSLAAECDRCRHTFTVDNMFHMQPGADVTFTGNFTICPRCGGRARIADMVARVSRAGELDVVASGASLDLLLRAGVLVQATLARERLEVLSALQGLQRGDLTLDDLQGSDNEVVRKLSDLLPRNRSDYYALLALLISLVALWPTLHPDAGGLTTQDVVQIVQSITDERGGAVPLDGPVVLPGAAPAPPVQPPAAAPAPSEAPAEPLGPPSTPRQPPPPTP